MIKPFIFNSTKTKSNELLKKLENIGLKRTEVINSEKKETWLLYCPWKEETVNLVFEKSYVPDGEILEDTRLSILINNTQKTSIDIKDLLDKKLTKPLRDVIAEKVVEELKNYTDKA